MFAPNLQRRGEVGLPSPWLLAHVLIDVPTEAIVIRTEGDVNKTRATPEGVALMKEVSTAAPTPALTHC